MKANDKWALEAWRMLPDELIQKTFEISALSGSFEGSDHDKIMCSKYGPCKDRCVVNMGV